MYAWMSSQFTKLCLVVRMPGEVVPQMVRNEMELR